MRTSKGVHVTVASAAFHDNSPDGLTGVVFGNYGSFQNAVKEGATTFSVFWRKNRQKTLPSHVYLIYDQLERKGF
jgi:hypothetical protein